MADTVIPPPDPNATPKTTFEPAPVPSTASTPAPVASPSTDGLAAPGSQPTTPSAAPGANGLATPNPTTAGTTPAAAGKEALSTLAQPAPLPIEAQKAAAAGAAAGASASSAAAGQAGQKQQSAQAGATAAASQAATKPVKPAVPAASKTSASATLDTLAPVMATIKSMLEGDDPIAKIQYNQILTGSGPRNQALLQGMGMKLKQANLDGQGAGDALLAMTARDQGFETSQLMANVSADSAKRLYDMNLHGFDKAIEIQQEQDRQLRTDLSAAIANGQFDTASQLWSQVYPGVPFDQGAAKAASPTATANFNSRMKLVDQYVSQGDATNAKAVMDKLAEDMPEMFGFPNDPAAAKASVAGVDFTTEAWQNNQKAINDASAAARTAALQGDTTTLSSSVDQLFAKMTPAAVESIATSAVKSRSLDEINQILAASNMSPVASTDEAALLDKTKFAKAVKAFDLTKDAKKGVVDGLLDTFAKSDPAIATDPAARTAAKAWLDAHAYALANSADGTSATLDPSKLNAGDVPPWDVSSPQAYLYYSWPVASFNADGSLSGTPTIEDPIPYNNEYKPGDLTTAKGKEDARLDSAYQQYKMNTPASDLMDIKTWYFATAGGQKPPDVTKLPTSLSSAYQAKLDAAKAVKDQNNVGNIGNTPTAPNIYQESSTGVFSGGLGSINSWLASHPDGKISVSPDGKTTAKVTGNMWDTGTKEVGRVVELQADDGTKVYYDPEHAYYVTKNHKKGDDFGGPYASFTAAVSGAQGK